MNIRDSEFVAGLLLEDGFAFADSMDKADVILFNSCSVRKHAEDRLFSNIADLKKLKKRRPDIVIGLIGCTAQKYMEKALERSALIDLVCGPGNEWELPHIIRGVLDDRCTIIAADKVNTARPELFPGYREHRFKSYVSIMEGCDNYCSYCIVPYVRGRERSREEKSILREVRVLADAGCKEITLLGQNVNSYKSPRSTVHGPRSGCGFVRLLEELNKVEGIERIRFMTSHPKDASVKLFEAMRGLDKVCEHLHLPLQSGSDRVLRAMNRRYTAKRYAGLIDEYRRLVPGGSVTTDIIVGFPSETERDFKKTVSMVKGIGFDGAYIFKYSPRPPARSAGLKDDVPLETKARRLQELLGLQCEISALRNAPLDGKVVEVLVDGESDKSAQFLAGRTRTNKVVVFKGKGPLVGKLVDVRIEVTAPHTLKGRLAE